MIICRVVFQIFQLKILLSLPLQYHPGDNLSGEEQELDSSSVLTVWTSPILGGLSIPLLLLLHFSCFPTLDIPDSFFISSLEVEPRFTSMSITGWFSTWNWFSRVLKFWWTLDNSKMAAIQLGRELFMYSTWPTKYEEKNIIFWSKEFKNFELMNLWPLISWCCYIVGVPEPNKCAKSFLFI